MSWLQLKNSSSSNNCSGSGHTTAINDDNTNNS